MYLASEGRIIRTRLLLPLFTHYLSQPVEKLSRERPLGNIFNFYVFLSILLQFAIHIVSMVYITNLSKANEECVPFIVICQIANRMSASRRGSINLEAKFEPNLRNTTIYLIGLSQQVSTFAINFQVSYSTQERLCLAKSLL